VARATVGELVGALVTVHAHPFAGLHGGMPCPRCDHVDHNGPSTTIDDAGTWKCYRCGARGTRYGLERHVLEDADALAALLEMLTVDA
jgi:hypothetical protein